MKVRKLAVALALAGGLGSNFSFALGMGEARIDSSLNQPLRAEIELVRPGDVSRDQIRASIASPSDFERAGVQKMGVLRDVKMEVVRNSDGQLVIQVTSSSPIREPFLNFLVELTWPNGRLMREYAFLVDPPNYREAPSASAPAAPQSEAEPEPAPARTPQRDQPETRERREAPSGDRQTADTRSVRSGENLWSVAGEVRPSPDLTREQVMLALQDLNPGAFLGNNINRLRSDAVLRLPSEEQIRRRSPGEARQAVRAQYQAFAERTAPPQDQPVAQATDSDPAPTSGDTREQSGGDELRLVVDDPGAAEDGSVGGSGVGEGNEELALALEELDRADRERRELAERLDELEQQLQTMSQLVELKDDQMAELQAQLAQAQKAGNDAAADVQTGEEAEEAGAAAPEETAPSQEGASPPNEEAGSGDFDPEPSLTEQLTGEFRNNPYFQIGAGSLGLALLALLLVLARRNARKDEQALAATPQENEDLLDLSESSLGKVDEQPEEDRRDAAVFDPLDNDDETDGFQVDEEEESLSMDDLERQLKSGSGAARDSSEAGSAAAEKTREMSDEGFDLDWGDDSDSDSKADTREDDDNEETLDFSSLESEPDDTGAMDEEDDASLKSTQGESPADTDGTDDDFDFDFEAPDTDPKGAGDDEDDDDLSFSLDDDFDLALEDRDEEDDDDQPLSEEDLATLGLDDEDDEDDEDAEGSDTELKAPASAESEESGKEQDSVEEPAPGDEPRPAALQENDGAQAASSTDATETEEEADFDDSFLAELDAELDKVTGADRDDPAPDTRTSDLDDLELDLSEDDLALMGDEGRERTGSGQDNPDRQVLEAEGFDLPDEGGDLSAEGDDAGQEDVADPDEVPDLSDSELDETLDEGSLDEGSLDEGSLDEGSLEEEADLTPEETEALNTPSPDETTDLSAFQGESGDRSRDEANASGEDSGFDDSLLESAADVDLNEEDDEFDFLEGTDESGTKLDLARAYVEMGDAEGAREILEEVAAEGSELQQKEARKLLEEL
ncbi:MAG: FimV/HubP family polar landmark protein [Oleiphilaceae bacterium]|nr:FimV/HubP family polar landmark protein [Oleiphilaceae bacterium]